MKNIFKILICSLLMVSFSCQDSENTIDTKTYQRKSCNKFERPVIGKKCSLKRTITYNVNAYAIWVIAS